MNNFFMYFDSWASFFQMGNHGSYVWTAYAFTLLILLWNVLIPYQRHRKVWLQLHNLRKVDIPTDKAQFRRFLDNS